MLRWWSVGRRPAPCPSGPWHAAVASIGFLPPGYGEPRWSGSQRPECKRRWSIEGWEKTQAAALRDWLLDRLEASELWGGTPEPLSVTQFAARVRHDKDFRSVLDLWVGHEDYNLAKTIDTLVADEHVPHLPAQRYKPSGLRRRAQWERTRALQRREDAGEKVEIDV